MLTLPHPPGDAHRPVPMRGRQAPLTVHDRIDIGITLRGEPVRRNRKSIRIPTFRMLNISPTLRVLLHSVTARVRRRGDLPHTQELP